MSTQKSINKVIWGATAGIMVFAVVLYATNERCGDQYGDQNQSGVRSQQQQMNSQSRQTATQAGVLCRLDDFLGSDVKSESMQLSSTMDKSSDRLDSDSNTNAQRDSFGRSNDEASATLGTVEELILGDQKNEIRYVVLQSDNKNYLIPWQAFHVKTSDVRGGIKSDRYSTGQLDTQQNRVAIGQRQDSAASSSMSQLASSNSSKPVLYLNLSKEQLKQAPTIDSISVEEVSNSQLKQRVDSFYSSHIGMQARELGSSARQFSQQQSSQRAGQQQVTNRDQVAGTDRLQGRDSNQLSMPSGRMFKATDVVGLDLKSSQDDSDLGTIKDMVVDTREGQIAYGLVDFGGFLGMGQKMAVVPWAAVTINADLDYASINATKVQLTAAVLEDDNIDKLSEAQFANNIHKSFNAEPYWQVYGYVPAEDGTSESKNNDDSLTEQQKTDEESKTDQQRKTDQQQKTDQESKTYQERQSQQPR